MKLTVKGFDIHSGLLDIAAQRSVLEAVRGVVAKAPLFPPETPYGKTMSVRMTAAGQYGWYSDKMGTAMFERIRLASRGQRFLPRCWRYGTR